MILNHNIRIVVTNIINTSTDLLIFVLLMLLSVYYLLAVRFPAYVIDILTCLIAFADFNESEIVIN